MKCPYCIKKCSKCGELLVANTMNFRKKKDGKYGLRAECKQCKSKLDKEYRQNNLEEIRKKDREKGSSKRKEEKNGLINKYDFIKIIESDKTWNNCPFCIKVCGRCNEILIANECNFNKDKKGYYGLSCRCKKCASEYKKEYHTVNPDKTFNYNQKRRLKEENQGDGISKDQWLEMMKFFDWKCAYSGEYIGGDSNKDIRSIDHITPISLNGEHEIWNCVPMHVFYNKSKHNNNMLDWYIQQPFYSEERLNKVYEWVEYAKNKYNK